MLRRNPIRKKRLLLRRGELTRQEKGDIRDQVYAETGGRCELKLHCDGKAVWPHIGKTPWDHWHLVHVKSLGSGGGWDRENLKGGCPDCHLVGLHVEAGKGKIIPKKESPFL
jgi:hypothetical protein